MSLYYVVNCCSTNILNPLKDPLSDGRLDSVTVWVGYRSVTLSSIVPTRRDPVGLTTWREERKEMKRRTHLEVQIPDPLRLSYRETKKIKTKDQNYGKEKGRSKEWWMRFCLWSLKRKKTHTICSLLHINFVLRNPIYDGILWYFLPSFSLFILHYFYYCSFMDFNRSLTTLSFNREKSLFCQLTKEFKRKYDYKLLIERVLSSSVHWTFSF